MAVLSDANLSGFGKYVVELRNQVQTLQTQLTTAEKELNSSTGATFRTEYAKGKKACDNIASLIDILQDLENRLSILVSDSHSFVGLLRHIVYEEG